MTPEEIASYFHTEGTALWIELRNQIAAALAQAEREREKLTRDLALWKDCHGTTADYLAEARAEGERLKEEFRTAQAVFQGMQARALDAEAALARVRAIVESNRKQNIRGQFICDDCGEEWPKHDLDFCLVGQIAAALEGR